MLTGVHGGKHSVGGTSNNIQEPDGDTDGVAGNNRKRVEVFKRVNN